MLASPPATSFGHGRAKDEGSEGDFVVPYFFFSFKFVYASVMGVLGIGKQTPRH